MLTGPGSLGGRPELSLGQAAVLLASSALGIVALTGTACADGGGPGGIARVTCPQGGSRCSLGVSERHVTRRSGGTGPQPSSGSGGDPAGLAKRFAEDNTKCLAAGPLASACMAANTLGLFAGNGNQPSNGGSPPAPPPIVIARRAAARLQLPEPMIRSSPRPRQPQLVGLPTWLWIDRSAWEPQVATATVPGVSATARATPRHVTWGMGDGVSEHCSGPGTPWLTGRNPAAASPDCGHTFRRSSAGQPGGTYAVTATVAWSVTWSGAGQSGSLPGMTTRASTRMRISESQAVNGRADERTGE